MRVAHLVGLMLLGLAADPDADPAPWIARLGASRYADRERAAAALLEIGRPALPTLRVARDARDLEIRQRATALAEAIERQRLTRPTRVTIRLRDQPLPVTIEALSSRSGFSIQVDPAANVAWRSRRVSLDSPAPLSFWVAFDRLCRLGDLRPAPWPTEGDGRHDRSIRLVPGAADPVPTSYSGPFRVQLIGLRGQGRGELSARLEIAGEPGLILTPAGPLKVLAAVDDRGQALLPPRADGIPAPPPGPRLGAAPSALRWSVPLRRPDRPGRRIERLSGSAPVAVAARKAEPVSISLDAAAGKPFAVGDAMVVVERVIRGRGADVQVALHVTRAAGPNDPPLPPPGLLDAVLDQIEVVDVRGRPCRRALAAQGPHVWFGEEPVILRVSPGPSGTAPAEFRVHGLIEATTDVPFEFTNVPLP